MKARQLGCVVPLLLVVAFPVGAADQPYAVKAGNTAPPKELQEPIRKLLGEGSVQFLGDKGEVLAEFWFCKAVPVKATEAQIQNGLTYQEVPETTLLGAVRVVKQLSDYRKQKVPPGVYTLRLGLQPMDGDHMGTAPYDTFFLASPASEDTKPDPMDVKALQELSGKTTNSHPAVFLLFPGKGAGPQPQLVNKGMGQWVLLYNQEVQVGPKKAVLPVGLTVVGASPSA